ncbi:hypothetical protein F4780DRAFT_414642 [Xylariomycetidae sp. FL0641]|nr:hypothetical protein F4780DRAFT_414642 [Xylariomycetidae sp. FL0641]
MNQMAGPFTMRPSMEGRRDGYEPPISEGEVDLEMGNTEPEPEPEPEPVPIVVSDILQPEQHNTPKIPSQSRKQRSPQTAPFPGSPQSTRLAVHIRSSPIGGHASYARIDEAVHTTHDSHRRSMAPESRRRGRPPAGQSRLNDKAILPDAQPDAQPNAQPRKRGRPKGWKPGTPYVDPQLKELRRKQKLEAIKKGLHEPKRRGRPPRLVPLAPRQLYLQSNAQWVVYECEWKEMQDGDQVVECPAELRNLETLRRHVYISHGLPKDQVCRFGKCAEMPSPTVFATIKEFEEHMEKTHFVKHLWHMGEGCKNDGIETLERDADKLPAYLFDKDGKQVTPSVRDQQMETDQQAKDRKRRLRLLLIQQQENALTDEEYKRQMDGLE